MDSTWGWWKWWRRQWKWCNEIEKTPGSGTFVRTEPVFCHRQGTPVVRNHLSVWNENKGKRGYGTWMQEIVWKRALLITDFVVEKSRQVTSLAGPVTPYAGYSDSSPSFDTWEALTRNVCFRHWWDDQNRSDEKGRKLASPMIAVANPKNCKDGTSSCSRNDGCIGMK